MRQFIVDEQNDIVMGPSDLKRLGIDHDGNVFCEMPTKDASEQNYCTHFKHLILALPELVNAAAEVVRSELIAHDPEIDEEVSVSLQNVNLLKRLADALEPYEKLL